MILPTCEDRRMPTQRGREDEWRRQQSAEDGYRHLREYNQNWRLGERYYEPDYGLNM